MVNLGLGERAGLTGKEEIEWLRKASRRGFLVLTGSAAAGGLLACGKGGGASTRRSEPGRDVDILNYLLGLEHVGASFYAEAVASGLFKGSDLATLRKLGAEETEHVHALTELVERLGGQPVSGSNLEPPLEDEASALTLAERLENTVAAAYLGQLQAVESEHVLDTVLSIHTVEGSHAAAISSLRGRSITPDGAFAEPAGENAALRSLETILGT